jgi:glycosyltransferase involved in cell wall biosynthesis
MINKFDKKIKVAVLLIGNFAYDARVKKEIDVLLENGYEVYLITNWQREFVNSNYNLNIKIFPIKPPFKGKYINHYIISLIKYIFYLINGLYYIYKIKPDIVHCNDFPTLIISMFLGKKQKIVYDSHELYSEIEYIPKTLKKIIEFFEKKLLCKKVDLFITTDEFRMRYLLKKYQCYSKRSIYLYNVPYYKEIILNESSNKSKFSVIYFGTLQPNRYLEEIILAGKYLNPAKYKITLLGPSSKEYRNKLEMLIDNNNLKHVVNIEDPLHYENLLERVKNEDISLIFYDKKSLNNYLCSPNKLFESIMVGLPVIVSDNPILKDIVEKYTIGIVLADINPYNIAIAIMEMSKKDLTKFKQNCIHLAKIYCWDNESKKLINAYNELFISRKI